MNFTRNGLVSWASVLVLTITLSVMATTILLQAVLNFSLEQIKQKVDVTIYFNPGADEDKILALQNALVKLPEVSDVAYVSAEEALANFRAKHENDYPTIQALDEISQNPLGGYLNVKAKEVAQYEAIANFLKSDSELVLNAAQSIDKVNYYQNKSVIERLNTIIKSAERLGFVVTLLFVVISIIITFNTIRLTIFISKEEIGIMRLVGASKARVQGPFMVEGAIYGILATLLTILITLPATAWLGRNMTGFLGVNLYEYFVSNILQITVILLVVGVLLGVISSLLAMRRYLNK